VLPLFPVVGGGDGWDHQNDGSFLMARCVALFATVTLTIGGAAFRAIRLTETVRSNGLGIND